MTLFQLLQSNYARMSAWRSYLNRSLEHLRDRSAEGECAKPDCAQLSSFSQTSTSRSTDTITQERSANTTIEITRATESMYRGK